MSFCRGRDRVARGALLAALLLGPAVCPRVAVAQEQGKRTLTEPELKAARDKASDLYLRANVRLQAARATFESVRDEKATLLAEQRRLESEAAGFIRDYQLEKVRQELHRVAGPFRDAQLHLEDARGEERLRRLELIRASWAWVTRLLEVADRVHDTRPSDAQQKAATAEEELRFIENLEHGLEAAPPAEVPPLEDPRALPDDQLQKLEFLFADLAARAAQRAAELEPERQKLDERVRRLDKLVNDRKVRELTARLARAREDLGKVAELVEGEKARAADYRARVAALEKERAARPLRGLQEQR